MQGQVGRPEGSRAPRPRGGHGRETVVVLTCLPMPLSSHDFLREGENSRKMRQEAVSPEDGLSPCDLTGFPGPGRGSFWMVPLAP